MDTEIVMIAATVLIFSINMLILFLCTKILQEVSHVLKECAKCEIRRYIAEERMTYRSKTMPLSNVATEVEDTEPKPADSLYRNKDGKLDYRVYNDNKKMRQAANAHTIDVEEEFEHKVIGAEKG